MLSAAGGSTALTGYRSPPPPAYKHVLAIACGCHRRPNLAALSGLHPVVSCALSPSANAMTSDRGCRAFLLDRVLARLAMHCQAFHRRCTGTCPGQPIPEPKPRAWSSVDCRTETTASHGVVSDTAWTATPSMQAEDAERRVHDSHVFTTTG